MVIILEDIDFQWEQPDIDKAIKLWKEKADISIIAEAVKWDIDETFLLLLHLSRQGKIRKRKHYIWGNG